VNQKDDNNAIMAQLLLQGTNYVNFVGYNAWVGAAKHVEAVQVTEWDEPQAVIGSYLQRYAYPDWYRQHRDARARLQQAHDHGTKGPAQCIQLRGEYLFVSEGAGGMRVYDVANIANKGVSQRIVSAPFSPLGQNTHIASPDATCVALPTNQPIAPERNTGELMRVTNQEQAFHPIYHYAFISDSREGLIVVNVDTLADGEPRNNFLKRNATWNGEGASRGVLDGARHITVGGHYLYITTPRGLVIVDVDDPLKPRWLATVPLQDARASALQFRYLWVTTARGLELVDVTSPRKPLHVETARVPLADARKVYVARTYAYVAAGAEGLVIVDVERPRQPRVETRVQKGDTPATSLQDSQDVIVGSTNASLFAYVADGAFGLKVLQLTAPTPSPSSTVSRRCPNRRSSPGATRVHRRCPCPRGWTGTVRWTRPAARSRCSDGSVRAPSMRPRWPACTSARTAASGPSPTHRVLRTRTSVHQPLALRLALPRQTPRGHAHDK
jgi:hypothetical protein